MDKFKNKYRIASARLQTWDYGSNGAYFITICTHNRKHYFGEIVDGKMQLNDIGKLAEQFWLEITNHFSFIELGNFVVMPNHVHGILIIDKTEPPATNNHNNDNNDNNVETLHCNVSTNTKTKTKTHTNAIPIIKNEQMANISPKQGSISTIIRSYKSVVSKNAHFIHADFNWQSRFHDHIIRNSAEFERIQNYISNNPLKWKDDKFYV